MKVVHPDETVVETWFLPFAVYVSLACTVYLFEQVETEKGGKMVAKIGLLVATLVLASITHLHFLHTGNQAVRVTNLILLVAIFLVAGKVVQD